MRSMAPFCNVIYWLALTIWVGVLISAGVAATGTFTVLPDPELGVQLEKFSKYEAPLGTHGRIAAGHVMEPIFTFVDLSQVVAGALVLMTVLMQLTIFRQPTRRSVTLWNIVRVLCIGGALTLFTYRVLAVSPDMNRDLRAYWSAAQAGDGETADRHYAAFTANHPRASRLFNSTLLLLLVSVAASAVAIGPPPAREDDNKSGLETPKLLKRG